MQKTSKELPRFTIKFANALFILGILLSCLISIYATYRIYHPIFNMNLGEKVLFKYYLLWILFGGISATFFFSGVKKIKQRSKGKFINPTHSNRYPSLHI